MTAESEGGLGSRTATWSLKRCRQFSLSPGERVWVRANSASKQKINCPAPGALEIRCWLASVGALPPHPCPLPRGEGDRIPHWNGSSASASLKHCRQFSLSLGERAGVRGNSAS